MHFTHKQLPTPSLPDNVRHSLLPRSVALKNDDTTLAFGISDSHHSNSNTIAILNIAKGGEIVSTIKKNTNCSGGTVADCPPTSLLWLSDGGGGSTSSTAAGQDVVIEQRLLATYASIPGRAKLMSSSGRKGGSSSSPTIISLAEAAIRAQAAAAETFLVAPSVLARTTTPAAGGPDNLIALAYGDCVGLFDLSAGSFASSSNNNNNVLSPKSQFRAALRSSHLTCAAFSDCSSAATAVLCFGASNSLEPLMFDARTPTGFQNASASLMANKQQQQHQQQSIAASSVATIGRGTKTGTVALSVNPLNSNVVATAQQDGVVALFDIRRLQQQQQRHAVAVSHVAEGIVQIFWNHSPADLLSVVTPSGVQAIRFGDPVVRRYHHQYQYHHHQHHHHRDHDDDDDEHAAPGTLLYPIVAAVQKTWCLPEVVAVDSLGQLHSFSLLDAQLSAMAPTAMPSSRQQQQQQQQQQTGGLTSSSNLVRPEDDDDVFAPVDEVFSTHNFRHHSSKKKKKKDHHVDDDDVVPSSAVSEVDETKFRHALKLSYLRRVNDSKSVTLALLSAVLNHREKVSSAAGLLNRNSDESKQRSSVVVSAAAERKVDDIISLSIAAGSSSSSGGSSSNNSGGRATTTSSHSSSNSLFDRQTTFEEVTAQLTESSLLPPRLFTDTLRMIAASKSSNSNNNIINNNNGPVLSLPPAAKAFFHKMAVNPATEAKLAALSVHIAIAAAVAHQDARAVASHRQILARVISDGSCSPHLTAKILHLLLSRLDSIGDAIWIVENSLLLPVAAGAAATVAKVSSALRIQDDIDDDAAGGKVGDKKIKAEKEDKKSKINKDKNKKRAGDGDESGKSESDEEEEDEEEDDDGSGSSTSSSSSNDDDTHKIEAASENRAASTPHAAGGPVYAMLVASAGSASSSSSSSRMKHVYAMLEALFFPLACDADAHDVAISEFFLTGGGGGGSSTSSSSAKPGAGKAAATAIKRRDKRSAKDARKLLRLFLRDCNGRNGGGGDDASSSSRLFEKVVRAALNLREMELRYWTASPSSATATGPAVSGAAAAEQCVRFFTDFEKQCAGRGIATASCSRYVMSRYVHACRVVKPSAALWGCSQWGSLLNARSCSRPLGSWLMQFALQLVDDMCDSADLIIDAAERLSEIAQTPPPPSSGGRNRSSAAANSSSSAVSMTKERDILKLSGELHSNLSRLIMAMYEGEAVFTKISSSSSSAAAAAAAAKSKKSSSNGNDESEGLAFMGEAIDRIGEAAVDGLGAWNQLLQDAKGKRNVRTVTRSNSVNPPCSVYDILVDEVQQFGEKVSVLTKLGDDTANDETFVTLMSALDDFLED